MIHVIFNRPGGTLKIFQDDGSLWATIDAGGDAWGNYGVSDDATPPSPPYGHACWLPQGHYVLGPPETLAPPIASEGPAQIPVLDISTATMEELLQAGKASASPTGYVIGGIHLPAGQLARYGNRRGLLLHGGGSNLAKLKPPQDPLANDQALCRTFGCTRLHNGDLNDLVAFLRPLLNGNTVIFSAVGDPKPLPL